MMMLGLREKSHIITDYCIDYHIVFLPLSNENYPSYLILILFFLTKQHEVKII